MDRTPGSGSGNQKGDLIYGRSLVEAKFVSTKKLVFKTAWLTKAEQQAKDTGMDSFMVIMGWRDNHPFSQDLKLSSRAIVVRPNPSSRVLADDDLSRALCPMTQKTLEKMIDRQSENEPYILSWNKRLWEALFLETLLCEQKES